MANDIAGIIFNYVDREGNVSVTSRHFNNGYDDEGEYHPKDWGWVEDSTRVFKSKKLAYQYALLKSYEAIWNKRFTLTPRRQETISFIKESVALSSTSNNKQYPMPTDAIMDRFIRRCMLS